MVQAWQETVLTCHKDETLRDAIERAQHVLGMQKSSVLRILDRFALQDDGTAKHSCFANWHRWAKKEAIEHERFAMQGQLEQVLMKHSVMANGALFALGKLHSSLFCAYWFHQWSDHTRLSVEKYKVKRIHE